MLVCAARRRRLRELASLVLLLLGELTDPGTCIREESLGGFHTLRSARLLIEYMDLKKQDRSRKSGSLTSIPFSCLDCLEEFEAAAASKFRRRLTSGSAGDSELEQDTKQRIPCQVSGVGIALRHGEVQPLFTISLAESLFEYLPVDIRLPGIIEWVLKYTPKAPKKKTRVPCQVHYCTVFSLLMQET